MVVVPRGVLVGNPVCLGVERHDELLRRKAFGEHPDGAEVVQYGIATARGHLDGDAVVDSARHLIERDVRMLGVCGERAMCAVVH
jgi:hypothetical protein